MNEIKMTDKEEEVKENKEGIKAVKEFGNSSMATPNERIQVLSIIGQIEGHMVT
jgi:hypothetical protein